MMTNAARNLALLLALAAPAWAQYPGHIGNSAKKAAPSLRSVAVVEWTGEVGKPSATRIIPSSHRKSKLRRKNRAVPNRDGVSRSAPL